MTQVSYIFSSKKISIPYPTWPPKGIASNDTAEGKAMNRRTRIIIMPKLDQFYDLLNPNIAPE